MKFTKRMYESYLNEMMTNMESDEFILAGKKRHGKYGTLLRKYDPIAFEIGYKEWLYEQH